MKKEQCNSCKSKISQTCSACGSQGHDLNSETYHPTLYAAEFLLYAFHFDNQEGFARSEQVAVHSLMMLVAEG